jgi:clan AA aspartic protease
MITGQVTAFKEAVLSLRLQGDGGMERQISAVIDTGYNGGLTLPITMIEELGLPWRGRGRALLADGRESIFDMYEAIVIWDGRPCRVAIDAAESDPLVGMSLLQGYEMRIQVVEGGNVTIQALPSLA